MGVYTKSDNNSLNSIKYMALELTTESIPYSLYNMLNYYSGTGTCIFPEDISSIRCDGVVEYCYEFYGLVVCTYIEERYPYESHWDISSTDDCVYHSTNNGFSPKYQSFRLTKVSTSAY